MRIAVVALGKIGLPLAVQFATAGHDVIGVDIDVDVVDAINGLTREYPLEAGLSEALRSAVDERRLRATTEYAEAIPGAEVVVVVVPLIVDHITSQPDFTWMDAATRGIAQHLSAGALVSYETTLPVGTTRGRWKPMLEAGSGLVSGADFHVAFSPERVLTGRVFADLRRYPKLVGALTSEGARRARGFYEAVLQFDERPELPRANGVWDLGSAEAAELAKLAETTYRDVNIGLANQFAVFAGDHGIDVHRVIEACNSQVFSHIHKPGIAVGGHCIPVYPRLYLSTDPDADIVRAARDYNETMPRRLVDRAEQLLGSLLGMTAVVLGVSYRSGVKETAFSGVFPTVATLADRGATVSVHDPLYSDDELRTLGFTPHRLGDPVDVAVVHTDHDAYRAVVPDDFPGVRLLVDGRNCTDAAAWMGVPRIVIGEGTRRALLSDVLREARNSCVDQHR